MLIVLAGDEKSDHFENWQEWLHACDYLNERYLRRTDICPFADTEMLFAGYLACAATLAGCVAFPELSIAKKGESEASRRYGRSDLYVDFPNAAYSFEMKRSKQMANLNNLAERLRLASRDIDCVPDDEHDFSAALLYGHAHIDGKSDVFERFARESEVDYAFKFEAKDIPASFLFVKLASRDVL